jgi:hypothetical protein
MLLNNAGQWALTCCCHACPCYGVSLTMRVQVTIPRICGEACGGPFAVDVTTSSTAPGNGPIVRWTGVQAWDDPNYWYEVGVTLDCTTRKVAVNVSIMHLGTSLCSWTTCFTLLLDWAGCTGTMVGVITRGGLCDDPDCQLPVTVTASLA